MSSTVQHQPLSTGDRADDRRPAPVGIIGLGAMGATLARTFLAAGHPTTVWNRTASRAAALAADGAVVAASPADAITDSEVVVVIVRDHAAVRSVLDTAGDAVADRTIVNLTSSTPEEARETAAWVTGHGARYLDGAIMVPTPMIGTDDSLVLVSGDRGAFDAARETLSSLGGEADLVGVDPGLASLYDIGMLDVYFAGMASFLHAAALLQADGIDAATFLPYAEQIVAVLGASLADLARDVDAGSYPGTEDTLDMEVAAMDHIVHTSQARGVASDLPEVVRDLARRAAADGHGGESFSRIVEQLRRRPRPDRPV